MTLRLLTAGESHGPAIVSILDGMPAGIPIDTAVLKVDLQRRQQGSGSGARMKIESDRAQILGGVMGGLTTGAPIAILIENLDHPRWAGKQIPAFNVPRPGHADLAGAIKYGHVDLRPVLERASARETAARVAAGAICRALLAQFDILVGGYVSAIAEVDGELTSLDYPARISAAKENDVHCPDPAAAEKMEAAIQQAMRAGETLGGTIEVVALGVPPGLGSYAQWDRRLDGRLGAALLSIPAIKGVEIGPAFENARLTGTQVADPILLEGDRLERGSDRSGGTEGGVSTGQPILLRMAMKPIPTTLKRQLSVDLAAGKALDTVYERSDFCPVPRAVVVCEAMTLFVLADALLEKLGGDSLDEIRPRFAALRRAKLSDLKIDGHAHGFWPAAKEGE